MVLLMMTMTNGKLLKHGTFILILFAILSVAGNSKKKYPQEERQAWFGAEIDYSIAKDFEISLSEELRYYKDRTTLAQSLTDFGGYYKITGWFKSGLFFRYRVMPDEEEERFELYSNFTFKFVFLGFNISDKVRLHIKLRENDESINNFRNKLSVGYCVLDWLEPYAAAELFYRFMYTGGDRLAQGRYYTGLKLRLSKSHEFGLFFMREQEYNTNKAIHSNVIGLEYCFSL